MRACHLWPNVCDRTCTCTGISHAGKDDNASEWKIGKFGSRYHNQRHRGVFGGTFAAYTPQGVEQNSHSTSALGNSVSCTVCYYKLLEVTQETSPLTLLFFFFPISLFSWLMMMMMITMMLMNNDGIIESLFQSVTLPSGNWSHASHFTAITI